METYRLVQKPADEGDYRLIGPAMDMPGGDVPAGVIKRLNDLAAEVERLRDERRWRSTADELPPDETDVICAYAGFKSFNGSRQGFAWFDGNATHLAFPPTHWMPLPAPPVEEE